MIKKKKTNDLNKQPEVFTLNIIITRRAMFWN